MLGADDLPESAEELRQLVLKQRVALAQRDGIIERLKAQLAWLRRQQFGRSSEKIEREIEQLELQLEDLEENAWARLAAAVPEHIPVRRRAGHCPITCRARRLFTRRAWDGLRVPRLRWRDAPTGRGQLAGAGVRAIKLPGGPAVRPKLVCRRCERIVQSEAPSRPITRGLAGPGLLAHVLVAKYADHLPLYRQSEIYAREGVELDRSTLAGWVGGVCTLLQPLDEALAKEMFKAGKLHTDDTPVPVLAPGHGKTRTGRLWVYVRDDRAAGDSTPPMALFRYSADRKGERPRGHLQSFKGFLQADGYAGYSRLYGNAIVEVACWAHVRRKFHDEYVDKGSELARQALEHIGLLCDIETGIRGHQPVERQAVRQARAGPVLEDVRRWLDSTLRRVPGRSGLAAAIRYARSRWEQLCRYRDDGRLETDSNAAERACEAWRWAERTGCSPALTLVVIGQR